MSGFPGSHRSRRAPTGRSAGVALAAVLALGFGPGCRSHEERIQAFREAYSLADFRSAEAEVDSLIADESKVDVELVESSRGLDETIDANRDDVSLYLLEKAMTRLALGDPDSAIDLLRRSRDALDRRHDGKDVAGWFQGVFTDDTAIEFAGADYEHLLVRTMLVINDLLEGGEDAFAYALQIDEKQDRILNSAFGEGLEGRNGQEVSYNPREQYRRLAVGAYLQGVVQEAKLFPDEAAKAYARASDWSGGSEVAERAFRETSGEVRPEGGTGTVHVLYLAGTGPFLVSGRGDVTDLALELAKIGAIIADSGLGLLTQAPVPVPVVALTDPDVPPLPVTTGGRTEEAQVLLDVNTVALQELDANMPWIVARAVVRRAVKATVSKGVASTIEDDDAALVAELLGNFVWTATERPDLRSWTSLPAQIQVARIRLAEGAHDIDLGPAGRTTVRVRSGRSSFVVIVQPDLRLPGVILTDLASGAPIPTPVPVP